MLCANVEDRGEIIAEITLTRLTREAFKHWEITALGKLHTRQRRIVAAETALVVLEAQRYINYWKLQVELKRRRKCRPIPRSV